MSRRRRHLALLAALMGAAFACAPAAQAATSAPAPRVAVAATLTECTTAPAPADRDAIFTGSMPAIAGGQAMAMRFTLYERAGDATVYKRLKVPGFDAWERSQPDVAGFVYDKRVEMLDAPAAYRVTVDMRWYDDDGHVVRTGQRTSPTCREPDVRPDLQVTRVTVGDVPGSTNASYAVTLLNDGLTATTDPFATGLTVNGGTVPAQTLDGLDAGSQATLTFVAPHCTAGTTIIATADVTQVIDEVSKDDDVLRVPCP